MVRVSFRGFLGLPDLICYTTVLEALWPGTCLLSPRQTCLFYLLKLVFSHSQSLLFQSVARLPISEDDTACRAGVAKVCAELCALSAGEAAHYGGLAALLHPPADVETVTGKPFGVVRTAAAVLTACLSSHIAAPLAAHFLHGFLYVLRISRFVH